MKKLICAISVLTLLSAALTSCGDDKPKSMVDNGAGSFVIVKTEPPVTLPKVKSQTTGSGETAEQNGDSTAATVSWNSDPADTPNNVSDNNSGESSPNVSNDTPENTPVVSTGSGSGSNKTSSTSTKPAGTSPQKTTENAPEEVYYLEGIVYKNNSGSILIHEPDLNWVSVSFKDKSAAKDVKIGDRVLVTYNGELATTFPCQASGAYSVEITDKAETEYKLQRFSCKNLDYDLKFSILMPTNWNSKDIDYPSEGDFTDWGIRLMPEGESTGLDISWHSSFAVREPYDISPIKVNGLDVQRYSKDKKWRFYVYDNDYIASNTFYGKPEYDTYTPEMEFMLETIAFDSLDFIN